MHSQKSIIILLWCFFLVVSSCKQEEGQIIPKQQAVPKVEANYDKIWIELEQAQEKVRNNVADIPLRSMLVNTAVDTMRKKIRALGYGEYPANASSPIIARQSAQEAAYIDGCYWLAYIREWSVHPETPEFGKLQTKLPGASVVKKEILERSVKVLVEINLKN